MMKTIGLLVALIVAVSLSVESALALPYPIQEKRKDVIGVGYGYQKYLKDQSRTLPALPFFAKAVPADTKKVYPVYVVKYGQGTDPRYLEVTKLQVSGIEFKKGHYVGFSYYYTPDSRVVERLNISNNFRYRFYPDGTREKVNYLGEVIETKQVGVEVYLREKDKMADHIKDAIRFINNDGKVLLGKEEDFRTALKILKE
jgi:hypothetical protein